MTTACVALILLATNAAVGLYAVGLLRRLRESEIRRLDAESERQDAESWADKFESEAASSAQALGNLRRQHAALEAQHAALESQHASLQAMYALRTVEMLKNSRDVVMVNVAWKRNK